MSLIAEQVCVRIGFLGPGLFVSWDGPCGLEWAAL